MVSSTIIPDASTISKSPCPNDSQDFGTVTSSKRNILAQFSRCVVDFLCSCNYASCKLQRIMEHCPERALILQHLACLPAVVRNFLVFALASHVLTHTQHDCGSPIPQMQSLFFRVWLKGGIAKGGLGPDFPHNPQANLPAAHPLHCNNIGSSMCLVCMEGLSSKSG